MERQTITGNLSTSGRLSGALSVGGGTTDYNELENKPTINGVELVGNMNLWQPINFSTEEQNTGIKWTDGKDIYALSIINVNFNSSYIDINIPFNIDIKKFEGGVNNARKDNFLPIGYGINELVGAYQTQNGTLRFENSYYTSRPVGHITLFYTKTTD